MAVVNCFSLWQVSERHFCQNSVKQRSGNLQGIFDSMQGLWNGGNSSSFSCPCPVNCYLLYDLSGLFLSHLINKLAPFTPVSFCLSILSQDFVVIFLPQDEFHSCTYQSSGLTTHSQHDCIGSSSPVEFSLMWIFFFVFHVFMVNKIFNKVGIGR